MATPLTDGDKFLLLGAVGDPATRDRIAALLNLAGTGDVTGPGSSTDNALVRFDGATGSLIQNSGVIVDDSNNISGIAQLSLTNLRLGSGSVSTPSYSFTAQTNSGMYLSGNAPRITASGADQMSFSASAGIAALNIFTVTDGSAASPAIQFSNDGDTGFYRSAGNEISASTGGSQRMSLNSTELSVTHRFLSANGTANAPSYAFNTEPDCGFYISAANEVAVSVGGIARVFFDTGALQVQVPIKAANGLAGTPSITFASDPDSGLYSRASNQIGISTGGTDQLIIDNAAIFVKGAAYVANGTSVAPTLAFESEATLGLYRFSASVIGIAGAATAGSATAGGASALPALPAGYLFFAVNGTNQKIPYYNG